MNIYSGYHITKPPLIGTYRKYLSISFKKMKMRSYLYDSHQIQQLSSLYNHQTI